MTTVYYATRWTHKNATTEMHAGSWTDSACSRLPDQINFMTFYRLADMVADAAAMLQAAEFDRSCKFRQRRRKCPALTYIAWMPSFVAPILRSQFENAFCDGL